MRVDFAFLADSATPRADGRVDATAIGPFTLTASAFPATIPHFAVVPRIGFAPEDNGQPASLRVRIVGPNAETVAEQAATVDAPRVIAEMTPGRTHTRVLNFYNVRLPEAGAYQCHIALNGVEETRLQFDATQGEA